MTCSREALTVVRVDMKPESKAGQVLPGEEQEGWQCCRRSQLAGEAAAGLDKTERESTGGVFCVPAATPK